MHELSVTQGLVDTVVREGKKAEADRVLSVSVAIGKCSCISTEILTDYFKILCEDTIAEEAVLHITRLPGKVKCRQCRNESMIPDFRQVCPICKSRDVTLVQGNEFYIESIEVENE